MFGDYKDLADEISKKVEKCHQEYEATRRRINKQPGYQVDWDLVDRAWETAVRRHCSNSNRENWYRYRKASDLYINHPRAVMEELARLRCKSGVLAAALLHDTMEDCSMTFEALREGFSYEVAGIVSAVTAIKNGEKEDERVYAALSDRKKHKFLDLITGAKLPSCDFQREAFLIRFADRANNLQTIDACGDDQVRIGKVFSTRAFLIPAAQKLGMRYFEVILNEWCMRFEGEDYRHNECALLLEKRTALTRLSSNAYTRFDQVLQGAIAGQTTFDFPAFNPYAKLRGFNKGGGDEMRTTGRRVLLAYELKQQWNPSMPFERGRLDMWEIILTCKDRDARDMLGKFLAMYRNHLRDKGILFEYIGREGDALVVRLTDSIENNYRIVLLSESRLEPYFIGSNEGARITMIHEQAPSDALRPQITVYSCSPRKVVRKHTVPYGATALDFAFILDKELGLAAKSAKIRKWLDGETREFLETDHDYPLGTVLSEGDIVRFDAVYERVEKQLVRFEEAVKIDSMLLVNTQYGKNCLIHHFTAKYEKKDK